METKNENANVLAQIQSEISVSVDASDSDILSTAKTECAKWLEGKEIIKEIIVPKKLVNIVIKG